MRASRAFVVAASMATVGALQHDKVLRYSVQPAAHQHQQQAVVLDSADAAALLEKKTPPPPASAAEEAMAPDSTRYPHDDDNSNHDSDEPYTQLMAGSGQDSRSRPPVVVSPLSISLSLNSTMDEKEDDGGESEKDQGAAGPVAKASLFPLAIGLAAAVVML